MNKHILVIDDERHQAMALSQKLNELLSSEGFLFSPYFEEDAIRKAIYDELYSLVILDIRMDKFNFDGIKLLDDIYEANSNAKTILVSAFTQEYFEEIKNVLLSGRVLDVSEKKSIEEWSQELANKIKKYYNKEVKPNNIEINTTLLNLYSECTIEKDSHLKGKKFEDFLNVLFLSLGFKNVYKRVKDITSEVDLIIRNDINDNFLYGFGSYILVEAKNRPTSSIDKNDYIIFKDKLDSTNHLSKLGIIATTGNIPKTAQIESLRKSTTQGKIIFFTQNEFLRLIHSENKLEEFKKIIDFQVRSNFSSFM